MRNIKGAGMMNPSAKYRAVMCAYPLICLMCMGVRCMANVSSIFFRAAMKLSTWICISVLFDSCGDRAWNFLVGIYLTKLTPGSMQLSAIYGLLLTSTTIIFSPLVGKWIDGTNRLRVIRILLLLQNMLFVLSAALIPVCLHYFKSPGFLRTGIHGIIVLVGALSNLANLGVKVSVSRDWLVVVCRKDNDHLAKANTLRRVLDLLVGVGAPIGTGALLGLMSDTAGVLFICSLNTGTKFIEYIILLFIYRKDISLTQKNEINGKEACGSPALKETVLPEIGADNKGNDCAEAVKPTDLEQLSLEGEENTARVLDSAQLSTATEAQPAKPSSVSQYAQRVRACFLWCIEEWLTYKRQSIALAGLALSLLYTNILNFHAITASYAHSLGFKDLYLSIGFGLGNLFGFLGAMVFPFIRQRVGLPKTGLVGNVIQLSFLSLCVISVWLPGSPASFLHHSHPHEPTQPPTTHSPTYSTTYTYTPSPTNSTTKSPHSDDEGINVSVLLLCIGIITSRPGLWLADLTITQLQQEYVPAHERGMIGGVQNALNSVFDLFHYGISVGVPYPRQFWILIFLSVFSVFVSFASYLIFNVKFQRRQVKPVKEEPVRDA